MNVLTKYSSTLANDASYGSLTWFNIVSTPNSDSWGDSRAQSSDLDGSVSNYLKCTNFNFSIPTGSVIIGITAELYINGNWQTETLNSLKLVKNNIIVGTEKGDNSLLTITNPKTFGGSSDLWGTTWTAADISNSNFGLVLACQGYSSGSIVSIIGARITINYISSQHNYVATGGLILSKVGAINEDFSINFGALKNSNVDAGYSVRGAGNGGYSGDGSGGLSYNGYVVRSDSSPYEVPAILYAPCAPDFTAEIKFVCPSETTGSLANLSISLFYRVKNATNYRRLILKWYLLTPGGTRFALEDELCYEGIITRSSWSGIPQMLANKQSYVIFNFKIVGSNVEVIFNNLNTVDIVKRENTLFYPTILQNEGGVGFGFDSNELLQQLNSIPGSTSFKPDYFKALNIPYENLGGKFNTNGGLTLSGSSSYRIQYSQTSNINLILSGTAIAKTPPIEFTGGLVLSKVGIINEDFSVNLGVLKNSNADAGYSVLGTGNGGQIGDGSGGLSYNGYVVRSDAYPDGYAIPAALYAPSSPDFTGEIKFVCPSKTTGSLADLSISLFYRFKDSSNYRELKIGWFYIFSTGISKFYIDDIVSDNGVITKSSWLGIPSLEADKQSYVIFKFRIVNDQAEVIFKNLNTLISHTIQQTLYDPLFLADEGGVGFGFDSNEKLRYLNLDNSSTSFKPDYFQIYNIPYENLGGKFNTNGGLALSGSSKSAVAINYSSVGSLQLSGNSIYVTKSANFILDGTLFLSGQSICISKDLNYSIDSINNPLVLDGNSIVEYKPNYKYESLDGLILSGDSNEFYRIDYVTIFNGGLILSGDSIVKYQTKYTFNGGLILSGDSIVEYQTKYIFNGGLILSGDSIVEYQTKYIFNGGLILSGDSNYAINTASYHYLSTGGLILGGSSNTVYKTNYYVLSTGNLILGGSSNTVYKFVYKYYLDVNLILISNNLIEYSVNLQYLLSDSLLTLFGKSKTKNRLLVNNVSYISNNINSNEVKLISTKKQDKYLQWQLEDNVVVAKFANK